MKLTRLALFPLTFALSMSACTRDDKKMEEALEVTKTDGGGQGKDAFTVDQEGKVQFKAEIVYFAFDSDVLTDDGQKRLNSLGDYLKKNKNKTLQIEGHSDQRGSVEYNLALGERRAGVVKRYLANLGVEEKRLTSISYGKEKPAAEGEGESIWWQNRRADFILSDISE